MKLFDTLLARIAPYDCLVCGDEGPLLCRTCLPQLGARVPSRCFRCQKLTGRFQVCDSCRPGTAVGHVWMGFVYSGYTKEIIKEFKFNGKRAAAHEIAELMKESVQDHEKTILVHIPTATKRIRERGYDHAKLLAAELAAQTGSLHLSLLARASQHRQLGAGRSERLKHIAGAFRIIGDKKAINGAHILLVDDVITTGATLSEAAKVLRAAGARHVDAAVFAQTIL